MAHNRRKNNVDAINYAIKNNRTLSKTTLIDGETTTTVPMLAEDLSNLVEIGTKIAELDADQLKSFAKDVAMGLGRIEMIRLNTNIESIGIIKNNDEYIGALMRVAIKNLPKAQHSHASNLINGTNYIDGKYYGLDLDSVIFSDESPFKVPYSIGYEDIRAKFVDAEWVTTTLNAWAEIIELTVQLYLKGMEDDIILKLIVETIKDGRVVHLITGFNQYYGYQVEDEETSELVNTKTLADIRSNDTLSKQWVTFIAIQLGLIKSGFNKLTKLYNNGEVYASTPTDRIKLIGLTEFMKSMNYLGRANMFNDDIIPSENVKEILAWQSNGGNIIDNDMNSYKIKDGTFTLNSDGSVKSEDATTYSNIAMIMYDEDMAGITPRLNKVGIEEVGAELYVTYHNHYSVSQYLDLRGNSVVFTLD